MTWTKDGDGWRGEMSKEYTRYLPGKPGELATTTVEASLSPVRWTRASRPLDPIVSSLYQWSVRFSDDPRCAPARASGPQSPLEEAQALCEAVALVLMP